jgi:hypothetical protein
MNITNPNAAFADDLSMDVRYLQTCLKQKNASLDVLVLMDSSRSLRDGIPGDRNPKSKGSDPEKRRGPILASSLKLLQELADDSGSEFRVNLKNFGANSDQKSLGELKSKWRPWTEVTKGNSQGVLKDFVERALFNESPGTEWANGLATARLDFNQRISEAKEDGTKSCSIMFWITDGVPSNPSVEKSKICSPGSESSIEWFRERNILVLGGLLKPKDEDSSLFAPIVRGDDGCGRSEPTWTSGSVIEANDINSLAWGFVSLVANLKNLVNLDFSNGKASLDRGTSQIEIFVKGLPTEWQVRAPRDFSPGGGFLPSWTPSAASHDAAESFRSKLRLDLIIVIFCWGSGDDFSALFFPSLPFDGTPRVLCPFEQLRLTCRASAAKQLQ